MSKIYYKNSLKFTVLAQINKHSGNVVLREDIEDLASPRQISRALQALVEMGELIKLGSGVYVKSYWSPYLDRAVIREGFDTVCKEALTRLGVDWEPGQAEKNYNTGRSTQIPVRSIVRLKSRFRRQLTYGNRRLIFEDKINAR